MVENKEMNVISEDEKSYLINMDGVETRFIKIDLDKIKIEHVSDLQKASEVLSKRNIDEALFFTNGVLKNPPTVIHYEDIANQIVKFLERFHFDLKPHNLTHLVHSLIKNISTETYGKAQTFMHQVELWNKDLKIIQAFRTGVGD